MFLRNKYINILTSNCCFDKIWKTENSLVSKLCKAKLLQNFSYEETCISTSWMAWGEYIFNRFSFLGWNVHLNTQNRQVVWLKHICTLMLFQSYIPGGGSGECKIWKRGSRVCHFTLSLAVTVVRSSHPVWAYAVLCVCMHMYYVRTW